MPDHPRRVARGTFALAPSCIGFGCASLGSRVSGRAGLRALEAAFSAGITWYDVAPAYGAGEAETLLAQFLKTRRNEVLVTTKVGIAPPARLGTMKLAYALGRPVIGLASGLRRRFRNVGATRNTRVPLDADLVRRQIDASLVRLGTDHVDVYALHDPDPDDVVRDDIRRALEDVLASGKALHIAVAGKLDACRAAIEVGAPYGVLQTSVAEFAAARETFAAAKRRVVLHSVFGVDGMRDRLIAKLASAPESAARLAAAGYGPNPAVAASNLLLDNALALDPGGVVLTSMFHKRHLAANLSCACRVPSAEAPALLAEVLA